MQSVEAAYRLKILSATHVRGLSPEPSNEFVERLERFSINSAVLNSELPHASRLQLTSEPTQKTLSSATDSPISGQNIIDSFNQGAVELLVATWPTNLCGQTWEAVWPLSSLKS